MKVFTASTNGRGTQPLAMGATNWRAIIMIDAVIFFGLINVVFEFIVLGLIPPRARLRLLGSKRGQLTLHIVIMCFVLWTHWGTLIGTMSGFFSFCLSMLTVLIARNVFGFIEDGNFHRRIIGYKLEELK